MILDARKVFTLSVIASLLLMSVSSTTWLITAFEIKPTDFQIAAPVGEQWEMTYGGFRDDLGFAVVQSPIGEFAVAGYTSSFGSGYNFFWFVLLEEDGTEICNQTFGTWEGEAHDICLVSSGGYALAGYQGISNSEFYVVRLDAAGVLMWEFTYGTEANEVAHSIIETSDGNLIMTGFTNSNNGDARVTKVNATTGIEEWSCTYGGPGNEWGRAIIEVPDGYVVAGPSNDWSAEIHDMWLFKIDFAGNLQWNKTFGSTGFDSAYDLAKDPSGYLVIA